MRVPQIDFRPETGATRRHMKLEKSGRSLHRKAEFRMRPNGAVRKRISDNLLSWFVVGVCLCAAAIISKGKSMHWHAAIAWTAIPFGAVITICRNLWNSSRFWLIWSGLLCSHIGIMWLLFSHFFPTLFVGMLYIMPFAFVETYLVLACVSPKWRIHLGQRLRSGRLD